MTHLDVLFRAQRAITGDGEVARCIGVAGGRVVTVAPIDAELDAAQIVDLAEDVVLLPGLVDTHVHVNEPGRTEWEGFASATRAAAAGGVTTIIDMPLNSIPPTTDASALLVKQKAAEGQTYVDVGFWGGAVPGNLPDLAALHEAGVFGFKCFLLHSGVEEFPPLSATELEAALSEIASFDGLMLVHAEDATTIEHAAPPQGPDYASFLASRPRAAENLAVAQVVDLAGRAGCRVHILHLSSSDALAIIGAAREAGQLVTAETCPHYLSFTAEEIVDGATQFKCCPPIREAGNRELLWAGLATGVIDCVVSDHSPCTPELKRLDTGDFDVAWGGIASLQLGLSAVWTQARARGFVLTDVARWMAEHPAAQAGLNTKGRIMAGAAADLCVFAPDEEFLVDAGELLHKNPVTPYHGRRLTGRVRETWLAGRRIASDGEPRGTLLRRGLA